MQVSKWLTVTLAVCLLGGKAFSQSADDIINKNLDAMGGKDKLATLTSLYTETSSQIMGQDLPGKTWISNGQGMRTEMEMMGSKMITVINKDKGWIVSPMSGSTDPQPLPDEAVKAYANKLDLAGQFFNYAQKGYTATLLGNEKVDGKDTYKIKLSKTGQNDVVFYIDATTYLIDKTSLTINMNGTDTQTDMIFSDYKKSPEGYTLPYSYKMTLPQGELDVSVTKATFNQPVDPKLFQNP